MSGARVNLARLAVGVAIAALSTNACQSTSRSLFGSGETREQPRRPDLDGLDEGLELTVIDARPTTAGVMATRFELPAAPGAFVGIGAREQASAGKRRYLLARLLVAKAGVVAQLIEVDGDVPKLLVERLWRPELAAASGVMSFVLGDGGLRLFVDGVLAVSGPDESRITTPGAFVLARRSAEAAPFKAPAPDGPEVAIDSSEWSSASLQLMVHGVEDGSIRGVAVAPGTSSVRLRLQASREGGATGRSAYAGHLDERTPSGCVARRRFTWRAFEDARGIMVIEAADAGACPDAPAFGAVLELAKK